MTAADESHPVDDLIRAVRPVLASDSIEVAAIHTVRGQLHDVIGPPAPVARRRTWPRAWRRVLGAAPVAISCAVALLIAAIALLALGGRGRPHDEATLRGPLPGPGANALISKLAVLRRPQTTADQLPAHLHISDFYETRPPAIIPTLSRLVATPPGAKIYLVVTEPARGSGALWSPSFGDQVSIVAITRSGAVTEGAGYPAADITDPTNSYTAGINPSSSSHDTQAQRIADAYHVAVLPDGVARVRWTFATRAGGPGPSLSARVSNNVALAKLSPTHLVVLRTTWYRANGHVAPTSSAARRRTLAAQTASRRHAALTIARRAHVTAAPAILHAFAVFDFDSRSGTRAANGYVISHPTLSELPLALLPGGLGGPGARQDLRDVRKVVAPAGQTLYIVPGVDTLCVFVAHASRLPYQRASSGVGGDCVPSLAAALRGGAGESASGGGMHGSMVFAVVPRTHHDYRLQTGRHTFRIIHPVDGIVIAHTPFQFG